MACCICHHSKTLMNFISFPLPHQEVLTQARIRFICGKACLRACPFRIGVLRWVAHLCCSLGVNTLSGLNATRHPVAKAARPAPASQSNSARKLSACDIKPLKSVAITATTHDALRDSVISSQIPKINVTFSCAKTQSAGSCCNR